MRAVAAAFRRCLQLSSHGDVPIVKPWDEETTVWNVCYVGREINADWFVIQRWRTESKVFANMIRCSPSICYAGHIRREGTYPVSKSDLKYWPVLLCQFPGYLRMAAPELRKVAKEWDTGYLRQVLDLRSVCSIEVADEEEDDRDQGDAGGLIRHCCNGDGLKRERKRSNLI